MNQELEKLLIQRLSSSPQTSQAPQISFQDQIGGLYDQLKKQDMGNKLESSFKQLISQNTENSSEYEQSLKSTTRKIFGKDMLVRAFGVANASAVAGLLPIKLGGLGVAGVSTILVGVLGQKFIGKGRSGSANSFFEGVTLAGMALAVGGFINLSGITSGLKLGGSTTPSTNQFVE